jgi:hypothetical protein
MGVLNVQSILYKNIFYKESFLNLWTIKPPTSRKAPARGASLWAVYQSQRQRFLGY